MKLYCPGMGEYTKVIKEFEASLGCEFIPPVPPTDRSIEVGSRAMMSELLCLPAKVVLGGMIDACEKGATDLIMFDSCGLCRLKTYWVLQQRALNKLGYCNVTVHPVRLGWGTLQDMRGIDRTLSYWKAGRIFVRVIRQILKQDRGLYPEILEESNLVKIGIVGEIYTILEPAVNKGIVEKIHKMGALVHNSLPLSYFIFKRLYNWGWLKRRGIDRRVYKTAKRLAHACFPKEIGGHGNESIIHTIYYGLKGFDGVLHLLPFPCMPESTVAPIIDDIGHEYNIPVMRLIFDVHTAEAGLDTRLEAFIDIIKRKKAAQKNKGD